MITLHRKFPSVEPVDTWDPYKFFNSTMELLSLNPHYEMNQSLWVSVSSSNYGGDYVPKDIKDYYDPRLIKNRYIAHSMKFSPPILALSHKVIRNMHKRIDKCNSELPIVGLHLRLEEDWIAFEKSFGSMDKILSWRLDQYDEQIEFLKKDTGPNFAIYAAHGEFKSGEYSKRIETWLQSHSKHIYRKTDFLKPSEFSRYKTDILSAVDYEVLTRVDHFIGNAVSSFTWGVSEKRSDLGKPSLFIRRPGYGHWWPVYVPRWNPWYTIGDPDPSPDNKDLRMVSKRATMVDS